MANYKKIISAYTTGMTLYCIITRDVDGYFLTALKTSFTDTVAYISLTEHATIKGLYVLNTNDVAWDDGTYTVMVYMLTGATSDPASDIMVAYGSMQIEDDLEVQKYAVTSVNNVVPAYIQRTLYTVQSDASNTSQTFKTDLPSGASSSAFVNSILKFNDGDLEYEAQLITGFNPTTLFVTLKNALSDTPSPGDGFYIING